MKLIKKYNICLWSTRKQHKMEILEIQLRLMGMLVVLHKFGYKYL